MLNDKPEIMKEREGSKEDLYKRKRRKRTLSLFSFIQESQLARKGLL